jgi:hypothetical protein
LAKIEREGGLIAGTARISGSVVKIETVPMKAEKVPLASDNMFLKFKKFGEACYLYWLFLINDH